MDGSRTATATSCMRSSRSDETRRPDWACRGDRRPCRKSPTFGRRRPPRARPASNGRATAAMYRPAVRGAPPWRCEGTGRRSDRGAGFPASLFLLGWRFGLNRPPDREFGRQFVPISIKSIWVTIPALRPLPDNAIPIAKFWRRGPVCISGRTGAAKPPHGKIRRLLDRGAEAAHDLLQKGLARFGRHFVEARAAAGAEQELVAGHDFIDEAERQRFAREPIIAVGDARDVHFRAALGDMGLERLVRRVELAAEVLAPRRRDLAQHRDGALELARRHLLEIDLVLLQQAMEVRDRRHHADRADHRERRGDDAVGRRGHHVAAARRHLVDRGGDPDLTVAQPQDLGGAEAVAGHRAARAFDPDQGLVGSGPGGDKHGVDFRAEALDRARAHVPLEGEHIDALARRLPAARPGFGLHLLLARLGERLALLLVEQRGVHGVAHVVVALVERADLDLLLLALARARKPRDEDGEAADRDHDDEGFHEKGGDVEPERHGRVRLRWVLASASYTASRERRNGRPRALENLGARSLLRTREDGLPFNEHVRDGPAPKRRPSPWPGSFSFAPD